MLPGPRVGAFRAHGLGQAANDLFGLELADRLAGSGIWVHVADPGAVDTGIRDEFATSRLGNAVIATMGRLVTAQSPAESARALLAVAQRQPHAVLIDRAGPVTVRGPAAIPAVARRSGRARRRWSARSSGPRGGSDLVSPGVLTAGGDGCPAGS